MSHFLRMIYVVAGTIINAVQFLVYVRIGQNELTPMTAQGGEYAGPFSDAMGWLMTAWAVEITIVQLGLVIYLFYGPVLRERARARVTAP